MQTCYMLIHGGLSLSTLVLCSAPSVPQLVFTITENSPEKAPTALLRHYAKRALTAR